MSSVPKKPFEVFISYGGVSPSGQKVTIAFEELKAAYPNLSKELDYSVHTLNFQVKEQKSDWYLKINPNGRIPALIHTRPDGSSINVFESAGIIQYLFERFDTEHKFTFPQFSDDAAHSNSWIYWAHAGISPTLSQAIHFRYLGEKIPYAISRYVQEMKRLYAVLDTQLEGRDYLVGPGKGVYSTAEINIWSWTQGFHWAGLTKAEIETDFPNLDAWITRIAQRPQVLAESKLGGRKSKFETHCV
ncbi:hypothetical protein BS47DRAFT_828094 [Hydnum rufescens UP504]|uniref:Glutathione S-transferase n=1 Tax=Hydnum rufescens UP504 TaxID=1448309 RepID=A0A9P6DYH2_9AGAM|nr:hypothetical protein BS47DRAFT_828094 [Hydnum rufescens UP504]